MSDDLQNLYRERAQLVEIENEAQDAKKYVWHRVNSFGCCF
jgi:hypothetical protein